MLAGAEVVPSLQQGRLERVALLQQTSWPHGQGVGLLIRRFRARVTQGLLGGSKLCKFINAVHQAYAGSTLASKILQMLRACSGNDELAKGHTPI